MTKNQKSKKNPKASSYFNGDESYESFSSQLQKLGLELRDITGDGNCCFRALSDQLEGNESQHLVYRKQVCQYIRQNRDEFEPFIAALIEEDDGPKKSSKLDSFEMYLKNMEQAGTYADNLCLVAFARLNQLNINIHQIGLPIWTISGVNTQPNRSIRELHLSYHNGEHYSSIRPLGDKSKMPTNIFFKSKKNSFEDDFRDFNLNDPDDLDDKIEQVMNITGSLDSESIRQKFTELNWDVESVINYFLSNNSDVKAKYDKTCKNKRDKKAEKKQRQMERQRNKFFEEKLKKNIESSIPSTDSSSNLALSNIETQAI